jgi:hypothetical protein
LKWRHNWVRYGQHLGHLGEKMLKQKKVNEHEHEQKVNVKKGASIKKERKSCIHIQIICKQKKWNA